MSLKLTASQRKALKEALKEAGRILVIGLLSAAATALTYLSGLVTDPTLSLIVAGFVGTALKSIDKYIHKLDSTTATGIVPF